MPKWATGLQVARFMPVGNITPQQSNIAGAAGTAETTVAVASRGPPNPENKWFQMQSLLIARKKRTDSKRTLLDAAEAQAYQYRVMLSVVRHFKGSPWGPPPAEI